MHIGRFTPSLYEQVAPATSSVGQVTPVLATEAVRPAAPDVDHFQDTILGDVPPAPTDEAREMVDQAAERVQELHRQNRELHFSRDETSNRVVIEVRDLEGNLIKTIPPAKALDILSGAEL